MHAQDLQLYITYYDLNRGKNLKNIAQGLTAKRSNVRHFV